MHTYHSKQFGSILTVLTLVVTILGVPSSPARVVAQSLQPSGVSILIPIRADNLDGFEDPIFNISGDGYHDDWVGTKTSVITGWIFTGVEIPKGATITNAYIRLRGFGMGGNATARIAGFAQDNTPPFAQNGSNKPSVRPATTSFVDWPNTWTYQWQWFQTPNLSTIIQEVIDRPGWTSNNSIGFRVSNLTGTGTNWAVADYAMGPYDNGGGGGHSVTLYITYVLPVVVLVHGWNGMGVPPPFCSSAQVNPDSYFEQVDQNLQAAGYYVGYAYLESSPCYTPPLVDNVDNLEMAIDNAKAANPGVSKVILITHSMGGLVARAYIEGPNYRNDVDALFTFGSPHLGAPDDLISFFSNGISFGKFCKDYQPALCDFSVLGMKLFNNKYHKNNSVIYHVISGDAPFLTRNAMGKITDILIPGPDDGIVPTDSGRATSLGTFDRWTTDEVHGTIFGPISYFIRNGGESWSYSQCIQKILVDGALNCGSVSTASAIQQSSPTKMISPQIISEPTLAQHTSVEYGTLQSGQVATRDITIEGGATLFASQWQSGTLALTLVDPNGQTINSAFAIANPSVVTYSEDTNAGTYYFPNAIAGTWKLVLQSVSVPAGGTTFSNFAAFDSNVAMTGNLDKQWYAPSTTATITATLDGSPSNAKVTANILRPDNVTDTLSLLSIGTGQYQASYIVPNASGYAEVRLVATGTTANSLPFERGASLAFQISPNTFSLNNIYTDTPSIFPGLSHYQYLNVTAGINATINGKVGLSADLVDGSGNFVAHGLTIQDVIAGTTVLTLQFSGTDIFASQHDGPYTLTNILLTDESGATLVTQQAQEVYITSPYLYTDFDIFPPIVTSIIRDNTNPTNLASVNFTVTFSETVTGVNTTAPFDDFELYTMGVTGASITSVSVSGTTYTVTVSTGSGSGTIRLDVLDNNSIIDVASNPLGGVDAGDGNYTSGEVYTITKEPTFGDVPFSHPYFDYIEILYANGYTGGCSTSPLLFCPDVSMSRAQSAVFMLRGNFGNTYVPVTPTHFFKDNWKNSSWGEGWAESMYLEGLTAGCSPSPLKFCPDEILTNVQLAVFGLRLKHGMSYPTPTATGTVFADMTDTGFWGTGWAEQAYTEGLIPSCGTDVGTGKPLFCPNNLVSRGFGAYVIVTAKDLTMP